MIDLSQTRIFELLLKAFLLGVALGFFYDAIRLLRMIFGVRYFGEKRASSRVQAVIEYAVVFLTDIIFWLVLGISSILLFYNVSGGVFRFSVYPAMLFGLFLYYISLGKLVLKLSAAVVDLLFKICRAILKLVALPVRQIKRFFIFLYHLTIGEILGKIKERRILRSQKKLAETSSDEPSDNGEGESEDAGRIYRRDGRISFGR